jgi:hypothetical protein
MSQLIDNIFIQSGSAIVGNKIYQYNDSAWRTVGLLNENFDSLQISNGILQMYFDSAFDPIADAINPILDFSKFDDNGDSISWNAIVQSRTSNNIINIVPTPSTVSYTPPYTLVPTTGFKNGSTIFDTVDVVFSGTTKNGLPYFSYDSGDAISEYEQKLEVIVRYDPLSSQVISVNHPKALNTINMGTPEIQYKSALPFVAPSDLSGLSFDSTGNRIFLLSNTNNQVYSYPLTNFDLSSVTNTPDIFTIYTYQQGNDVRDIEFNSSGSRMYIVDNTNKVVNQYNLSSPFDITTTKFIENYYKSPNIYDKTHLSLDGTKLYSLDNSGNIYKHNLSDPYEVYSLGYGFDKSSNYSYYRVTRIFPGYPSYTDRNNGGRAVLTGSIYYRQWYTYFEHDAYPQCFTFTNDGKYIVVATGLAIFNGVIRTYELFTPWDPTSTKTLISTLYHEFGYPTIEKVEKNYKDNGISDIKFSPDGTKFFILDRETLGLYQYNLSSAYNLSSIGTITIKPVDRLISSGGYDKRYLLTQIPNPTNTDPFLETNEVNTFEFSSNGNVLYVHNNTSIFKYTLNSPYDIGSVSYVGSYLFNTLNNDATLSIQSNNLYIATPNTIWGYQLDSDITSAQLKYNSKTLSVPLETTLNSIYLNDSDNILYVGGASTNQIHKFNLATPSEISSSVYDSGTSVIPSIQGITISETNNKLFVASGTKITEYDINDSDWTQTVNSGVEYQTTGSINSIQGLKWNNTGDLIFTVGNSAVESYKTKNLFRVKPL